MVGAMSKRGIDFVLNDDAACFIRALDSQKSAKKAIFGGGFLLSSAAAAAAAEKAKQSAIVWDLSDRERNMIAYMDKRKPDDTSNQIK